MRFHTTILQGDKTATGIRIPDEVVEALGSGKRPAVKVTIDGTFDGLSYSNRSWHALSVAGAKTDETRQRRIVKSIEALREGRPR